MREETFEISDTGRHWFSAFMSIRERASKVPAEALTLKRVSAAHVPGVGIIGFPDGAWMAYLPTVLDGMTKPVYGFATTRPGAVRVLIVQLGLLLGWTQPKD